MNPADSLEGCQPSRAPWPEGGRERITTEKLVNWFSQLKAGICTPVSDETQEDNATSVQSQQSGNEGGSEKSSEGLESHEADTLSAVSVVPHRDGAEENITVQSD